MLVKVYHHQGSAKPRLRWLLCFSVDGSDSSEILKVYTRCEVLASLCESFENVNDTLKTVGET